MRIGGKQLVTKNCKRVELCRGSEKFDLVLTPLPPSWHEKMRSFGLLDYPTAPKRPMKDGEKFVRNQNTGRVEMVEDENDPVYLGKVRDVNRRLTILKLVEHLKETPGLEFEATEPTGSDKTAWASYAEAIRQEVTSPQTGFTDDEIAELMNQADSLVSVVDLDAAVEDFLPAA